MPLRLVDHPLAQDALTELRDARTAAPEFRRAAARMTTVLAVDALRDLPTAASTVQTPLGPAPGRVLAAHVVIVPVLRAGLGMLDPVLQLLPSARVGHIGLQRDEATAVAAQYYSRLPPDMAGSHVLLLDPMLATGGSAAAAVALIKASSPATVRLISIVAAPDGVARMEVEHPDVTVFTPVVDRELNARKFIVPGLGDFGDRLYGTA